MIPMMSLMIGSYIITRMISFITRKDERKEAPIITVLAAITILISIVVIIDLFTRGASIPSY